MSKKNKKTSNIKNKESKNRLKENKTFKKDGIAKEYKKDFKEAIKEIREDAIKVEIEKGKTTPINEKKEENINEKIQSFISILFTIIVFILLIFLIVVLYNNYFKKEKKLEINKEEVCQEFIKKDYGIKEDDIEDYIRKYRNIFYNIEAFDIKNIENKDLLTISKFIIWGDTNDYIVCEGEDENCFVSKKEMGEKDLQSKLNYFLKSDRKVNYSNFFEDENTRLYKQGDKIILTFKEFEYETYRHDLVETIIDNNNVELIFSLSKHIAGSNYYNYVGSKKIYLKYENNDFVLIRLETIIKFS